MELRACSTTFSLDWDWTEVKRVDPWRAGYADASKEAEMENKKQ